MKGVKYRVGKIWGIKIRICDKILIFFWRKNLFRNGKSLSFPDGKKEKDGQEHEEQEYLKEQEQDGQESLEQEPLEEQTKLEELQEEQIFKDLINPTSVEVQKLSNF